MSVHHTRVLIIGSGFSGIGLGHRLLAERFTDFVILERSDRVGGVWNSNTYPGCQCDVPSHLYSFSFAPNPEWTKMYSPQPEIRDYLETCVERFGLAPYIRTRVEVLQATWDDARSRWEVETTEGVWSTQFLIGAVGPLTEPKLPNVPGIGVFAGEIMHSSRWNHDVDLTGKRVASIGTGASAIQYVPQIVDQVSELLVYQRTAPWITPHDQRDITDKERAQFRRNPRAQKRARDKVYLSKEVLILGFVKQPKIMSALQRLATRHMESQVHDPDLRRILTPDFTLGCKRILPSNTWYPALQKPNVTVVPHALKEIREHSVIGADGVEREVDVIIFGTGYHVADIPFGDHLRGRTGVTLTEHWKGSPRAYLGASIPDFPNYFMFLGPNTGLGHSSMIYMIEAQIEHITNAIRAVDTSGARTIEVDQDVHDAYNATIDKKMAGTVWELGGCTSFYQDANGRNATIYPDWTFRFRRDAAKWKPKAYRLGPAAPGGRAGWVS